MSQFPEDDPRLASHYAPTVRALPRAGGGLMAVKPGTGSRLFVPVDAPQQITHMDVLLAWLQAERDAYRKNHTRL